MMGIENSTLANSTEDPNHPCCDGERDISSDISGNRRPREEMETIITEKLRVKTPSIPHALNVDSCDVVTVYESSPKRSFYSSSPDMSIQRLEIRED